MTAGEPAGSGRALLPSGAEAPATTWPVVLDELEGHVLAAENALASSRADEIAAWNLGLGAWVPPQAVGPLPEELRERAARLLQHQLEVAERLVERITQSQRQRDLAARMSFGRTRPVAAYIDKAL